MKIITWIGLIFLEVLSLAFVLTAINHKMTIYPFLGDPDMPAWQNVVRPGNLYIEIFMGAFGCLLSFLIFLMYHCLRKLSKQSNRQLRLLLYVLIMLSLLKTAFLVYNFYELFGIASSIQPCDTKVTHILCADIR